METELDKPIYGDAAWSLRVAVVAVDALVDAGIVVRDSAAAAVEVVAEEVRARLALGDRPPGV